MQKNAVKFTEGKSVTIKFLIQYNKQNERKSTFQFHFKIVMMKA